MQPALRASASTASASAALRDMLMMYSPIACAPCDVRAVVTVRNTSSVDRTVASSLSRALAGSAIKACSAATRWSTSRVAQSASPVSAASASSCHAESWRRSPH